MFSIKMPIASVESLDYEARPAPSRTITNGDRDEELGAEPRHDRVPDGRLRSLERASVTSAPSGSIRSSAAATCLSRT